MNPGLCLDSGEFVTAAELNQRIEMKHELPPLRHPEPHSMTWTTLERKAIAEYAQQVADPLLARIADLEANALGWLQANGPSGWIDDLRVRAESLEVQLASGQEPVQIPAEIVRFAKAMQSEGYQGPKRWAAKIIDFVADYAHPAPEPAQQPLTLREMAAAIGTFADDAINITRAIEHAHHIKENP
jgi:hypothetical protein